ncbi:2,3-bisphosphoglycerate-dependent phosphoglycerate mutase [Xylocopilactobacillus apicola]|uniref:2,3-bisphosphoglycerate-dependent phosphoglycerate mutase n=1 Tax=Xylocopilactobacillus apicola TaxID=2932184 RepID=A0AAU9CYA1_9LACO|nr:2,3-bisphosphoglycerate-dependent phosphoglycerate mutase [Xylocopilactobacillus apicola]BDR59002.1 2,3-bisphosphoglycerate-dependent phosphoglycerate mutase 1 [Xylocopilactobacillus apicola]
MSKLILIRHGESTSNRDNIFTGWNDVLLTEKGIAQAISAGQKIKNSQIQFSEIHTSVLARAIQTANIIADTIDQSYLPLYKSWRLNERHYGALKGINKDRAREIYGANQVALWRRNFAATPPLLTNPDFDRRYQNVPKDSLPLGESLATSLTRVLVYYEDIIAPKLRTNQDLLLVAHGSTIRVLIKNFDQISGSELDGVKVANGSPIVYEFDHALNVTKKFSL